MKLYEYILRKLHCYSNVFRAINNSDLKEMKNSATLIHPRRASSSSTPHVVVFTRFEDIILFSLRFMRQSGIDKSGWYYL